MNNPDKDDYNLFFFFLKKLFIFVLLLSFTFIVGCDGKGPEEGYISNFKAVHNETKGGVVRVFLKYTPENECVIQGLRRVSKPGQRVYSAYSNIPKVRGSFGITILSTSKGIMTDAQAKA